MDKKEKRKKILKVSGLIGLFLIVFGLSYALFTVTLNGTKKVKISTGRLELQLLDKNNNPIYSTSNNSETSYEINLDNQVPVSDEVGLDSTAFEFKLKNSGNIKASYTIYLDDVALDDGETRIDDEYIRYSLTKNGSEENPQALSSRELDKGTIEATNTTNEYTLKIWIAEDATNAAMDKVFNATLRVEGTQYVRTGPFDDGTFAAQLYANGVVAEYNATTAKVPNGFDVDSRTDGLIKYTDAEGTTTFAYRGEDPDNYVDFSGHTWRILRIQSDGSIRLITTKIGSSTLETWYTENIGNHDDAVVYDDYCEDYSEDPNSDGSISYFSDYNPIYGILNRVTKNDENKYEWYPSLTCNNDNIISAKIGLITADEAILIGVGKDVKREVYLDNTSYTIATMSPYGRKNNVDFYITLHAYSGITPTPAAYKGDYLPVITLKANVLPSSGDGTSEHPYVID